MTCSINIKTQPRGRERDQSDWEGSNHKQQAENARKKTKTDIVNKKENQEKEPLNVKKSIAVGLYTDYHKPINTMGGGRGIGRTAANSENIYVAHRWLLSFCGSGSGSESESDGIHRNLYTRRTLDNERQKDAQTNKI